MTEIAAFLQSLPYFAALPSQALADIAGRATRRSYARRELVFLEGEPPLAAYFVMSGQVRTLKLSPQGREQVLARLGPGEALNLAAVFDGRGNLASAEAVNAVTVCLIPREDLLAAIRRYPRLAEAMLVEAASRFRDLTALVEDLAFRTVRARLARFLLRQASERGRRLTQAEMAAELGTVRDVIGRTLIDFQDDGLISVERHRIVVKNRARLEALAEI